jgi:hypothetical protein
MNIVAPLMTAGAALLGVLVGHFLQEAAAHRRRQERRRKALLLVVYFAVELRRVTKPLQQEKTLFQSTVMGVRPPDVWLTQFDHIRKVVATHDPSSYIQLGWAHQALKNLTGYGDRIRELFKDGHIHTEGDTSTQRGLVVHYACQAAGQARQYLDAAIVSAYDALQVGQRRRLLRQGVLDDILAEQSRRGLRLWLAAKSAPVKLSAALGISAYP